MGPGEPGEAMYLIFARRIFDFRIAWELRVVLRIGEKKSQPSTGEEGDGGDEPARLRSVSAGRAPNSKAVR